MMEEIMNRIVAVVVTESIEVLPEVVATEGIVTLLTVRSLQ